MMPLTFAQEGKDATIRRIVGRPEVKRHLESLGFIAGSPVSVIAQRDGNVIVRIREARVAVCRELAQKIMI